MTLDRAQPVIFGEVLVDTFRDGPSVVGGAPFNVAWHLRGFGLSPRFLSRVGNDADGRRIIEVMKRWDLATEGVQVDDTFPTGRVLVTVDRGEPTFEIPSDMAYDHIQIVEEPTPPACLIYHGSLGIRHDVSRRSLEALGLPAGGVFCDLNLRNPWWTKARIEWCLGRATWVKLNGNELEVVTSMPVSDDDSALSAARSLARRFAIENVVVTLGPRGAVGVFGGSDEIRQSGISAEAVVDTVGAGDAFSAVLILGIVESWTRTRMLDRAARFAAAICTRRGATSSDSALYDSIRDPIVRRARDD